MAGGLGLSDVRKNKLIRKGVAVCMLCGCLTTYNLQIGPQGVKLERPQVLAAVQPKDLQAGQRTGEGAKPVL